ncbi:hypothetical protein HPB47_009036, partial [Ixodes persulcatus]
PLVLTHKIPTVLNKRGITIPIFAIIGILTVAGACFAAVIAVLLYRSSTRELAEVASDQVASWAAPGLPSKLRFPASTSDARRVFCVYDNRLSERPTGLNFSIEDLRVEYCDDIVYGYVGLDSSATNIRSKLPKYDFLDEGFKRSSTRELAEVASDQVASWAAPGLPSKLRFPASTSDARRVFCVYDNRLSERPTGLNFSIEDLRVEYCDDIVYGYVGLDSSATNIRSKLPKYDFLDEGFK